MDILNLQGGGDNLAEGRTLHELGLFFLRVYDAPLHAWDVLGAFDALSSRLDVLTSAQVADELTFQNEHGQTAFHFVLAVHNPPIALVKKMCARMKADPRKRNILAIADNFGGLPLHVCARNTTSLEIVEFIIAEFPQALTTKNRNGETPLDFAKLTPFSKARFKASRMYKAILLCLKKRTREWLITVNQSTVKLCLVQMKREGMTAYVAATHINDLTPPQFVFKVVDEFVNREMRLLATEIVSFAGYASTASSSHDD